MKTIREQHKATKATCTKGKPTSGLNCNKSVTTTTRAPKQRRKTAGNKLIFLRSHQLEQFKTCSGISGQRTLDVLPDVLKGENKEFIRQPLPRATQPSQAATTTVAGQSLQCFQKIKLQLFPIDELTRKLLEMDKHNPYLELTLGTQKKISSVVKHLSAKWGNSKVASGELMLFPYNAQRESLSSHERWTLNDSDTKVSDVHAVIGSPAIFQLRYGWVTNVEPEICGVPLFSLHPEDPLQASRDQKINTAEEKIPCAVVGQDSGLASAQAVDNLHSASGASLVWADLSNISFGALFSVASANADANTCQAVQKNSSIHHHPVTCDSFDAAIAQFKAMDQSAPVAHSSMWDAEVTHDAFSFQAVTAEVKDAPSGLCAQNASLNPLRHHEEFGGACREASSTLQLLTKGDSCQHPEIDSQPHPQQNVKEEPNLHLPTEISPSNSNQFGKLDAYWPDSMGPFDCAAPSDRQINGGNSIGLGGLISNSLDAFQNFAIF